jgi:DNA modification methylase
MTILIITADCRNALHELPDQCVHCVVTSPPYWGLRDYGNDKQIGLEPNYLEYVSNMVGVFREMRRVLRDDGTLWLNLGDSYAISGKGGNPEGSQWSGFVGNKDRERSATTNSMRGRPKPPDGLKPKDLVGIPWRVAFALQADAWYLRQDIIWSKPNPMPESVTDRCTKAHEYLFLLSKCERYYYDQDSIAERAMRAGEVPGGSKKHCDDGVNDMRIRQGLEIHSRKSVADIRNKRSVWEISTQPFSEAHFATFPPALIEPCILAGCPKDGTVLDPFAGAGTTGLVADRLGRNAILIELNPEYAEMAKRRIHDDAPLFVDVKDYNAEDDFARSIDECYRAVRERKAQGGKGWP